ncbi:MAG: hypothetical protein ACJAZO_000104 [Myxococcota bacterium]|jgi:hypothetical protein
MFFVSNHLICLLEHPRMELKTEYEFTLPRGYVDADGNIHRDGVMRLANAKDEIVPLNDLRVQRNRAYLIIVLLSRVITKLGTLGEVNTGVIENMFAGDLRFLEELYNRINEDEAVVRVTCPECGHRFDREFGRLGES